MPELLDSIYVTVKDGIYITASIYGATAATAANYGVILIPRFPIEVLRITEVHETAGSDAGAVTLDVLNVDSGTAIASGNSMLVATFNLKSTANTPVYKQSVDLNGYRVLDETQRIALKTSGTLTDLAGVHITIYAKPYGRGQYR